MDTNQPEMDCGQTHQVMCLEVVVDNVLMGQDSEYPYFQNLKEKWNQIVLICLRYYLVFFIQKGEQ